MKVLLLQDVPKIGKKYEVKEVSGGYASNFILPRKLGVVATPAAIKSAMLKKSQLEDDKKIQEDLLMKNLESLKEAKVLISGKANEEGHLYAQIPKEEIVKALKDQTGLVVMPEFIELEKPVKALGEFKINVATSGKKASFVLVVENIAD